MVSSQSKENIFWLWGKGATEVFEDETEGFPEIFIVTAFRIQLPIRKSVPVTMSNFNNKKPHTHYKQTTIKNTKLVHLIL